MTSRAPSIGFDFGTTNSVAAIARDGVSELVEIAGPDGADPVFRSALCFWEDAGVKVAGGPWAIAEYLEFPQGSRFLQSFKSVAASAAFDHATVFGKRYGFEDVGRAFVAQMLRHSGGALDDAARLIVGRPVEYAGHRPDEALARTRYDAVFGTLGADVHYVYEPMGAAFSYASRIDRPATILVADFGGGTSDFSVVRIAAPGAARRCEPLAHAGVGIAGDRFDYRILDHLVLPLLGKGGTYRSFDKLLEIPPGYFADFGDWSRLALMRNRKTLAELETLRRTASDPAAIARGIAIVEQELGYRLYDAVGRVKRDLSTANHATFRFEGADMTIAAEVERAEFEAWIEPDIQRIEAAVDRAIDQAGITTAQIDRVFLTGGTSLIPRIRHLFETRFGADRIAAGDELTSIAHGLALIGAQDDVAAWAV